MIVIRNERPKNREHFSRLFAFCQEVVAVCHDLGITPILTGSLAVFGYTRNQTISVNDIDVACSKLEFPKLSLGLASKGIAHEVKAWHVLQARKDGLKVEFDSMEHWMTGLPEDHDTLVIDGYAFKVVSVSSLKEVYRRGLEAVGVQNDEVNRAKCASLTEKHALLCSV